MFKAKEKTSGEVVALKKIRIEDSKKEGVRIRKRKRKRKRKGKRKEKVKEKKKKKKA